MKGGRKSSIASALEIAGVKLLLEMEHLAGAWTLEDQYWIWYILLVRPWIKIPQGVARYNNPNHFKQSIEFVLLFR